MSTAFLNKDERQFQDIELIKTLLKIKTDENNINNEIKEDYSEEKSIELEEEDEDYSITEKINSDSDSEKEEEKDDSKIINIYKRHYETQSTMKKKVSIYKKSNKRTILKRKRYYVHQLLQRWWYALPKWPPENLDVSEKLKENKLRLVEEKNWKKEVELNSDDYIKCIELPGYKYVYITKEGKIYDFRPQEGKPSFNNLMKLNDIELHQYIVKALTNQLNDLEKKNFFSEKKLRNEIRYQLKIAKNNLSNLKGIK